MDVVEVTDVIDYWLCETGNNKGNPHQWSYRIPTGRTGLAQRPGTYRCTRCLVDVTKAAMKEHTDA